MQDIKLNPPAKFRANACKSKSELWVINEIQDGGHRYLEFATIFYFGHMLYFPQWLATIVQNLINLRQLAAVSDFVQKNKMAVAAILDCNFVTLDPLRNSLLDLKLPFKFHVNRVRTFWDITIRKFCKFGLKCLFKPPKIMFLGSFDS